MTAAVASLTRQSAAARRATHNATHDAAGDSKLQPGAAATWATTLQRHPIYRWIST